MSEEEKKEQEAQEEPQRDPTIVDELVERFGASDEGDFRGDLTARAGVNTLISIFSYLAKERKPAFDMLVDVTAADYPDRDKRFEVIYHFLNLSSGERLRLKTDVAEGEMVPSATAFWASADWSEREAYDMYGVKFRGHPCMKRLLMWEGFDGWPLRKDFPLRGKLSPEEHYREGDESRFRRL